MRRLDPLLLLPAIAGSVALLVVNRRGPYLSPDALAYIGTARNLLDGQGYTPPPGAPPLGNFAPLYTLLLAAVGALGPDPLTVARYVGPVLFGVTILGTGLLVRRLTGSTPLTLAAQMLVLAGADFLDYHTAALSEPLFLALAVFTVVALAPTLAARRQGALVAAAVLAGAACVTRYVGLALVAAATVALVLLTGHRRRAWMGAVSFAAFALTPLAVWLVWVASVTGRVSNRTAVFHPPGLDYVTEGLRRASGWIVPGVVSWPVRGFIALAAAIALVVAATRRPPANQRRLAALCALAAGAYLGALVVDRFLFDVTGRLDGRFLLPLHLLAIALSLWALRNVDLQANHIARLTLSAVVGLQLANAVSWMQSAVTDPAVRPGGYAAPAWERSELLDQVRASAPETPVYTNAVDAVWFHTGREAAPLPEKRIFLTGKPNPTYEAELAAMGEQLRGGLLVYFTRTPARRVFLPSPDELEARLGLRPQVRDEVGVVYRLP